LKSYVKLFGPNIDQALTELENLANDFSQIDDGKSAGIKHEEKRGFLSRLFGGEKEQPIIGDFDFAFSWHADPTIDDMIEFVKHIDEKLEPIKTRYTITSIPEEVKMTTTEFEDQVVSYIKFYGPSISKAIKTVRDMLMNLPEIAEGDILPGEATIGLFDFCFKWNFPPRIDQIRKIIRVIDKAIAPTGARYTITTKSWKETPPITPAEKHAAKEATARHQFKKDYQEIVGQPR
jgi:hypothetical protein